MLTRLFYSAINSDFKKYSILTLHKVFLLVLMVCLTGNLLAQDRNWDGDGINDNWSNRFNWSGDNVPNGIGENAIINHAGTGDLIVNVNGNYTINNLIVNYSGTSDVSLTINISAGNSLTVNEVTIQNSAGAGANNSIILVNGTLTCSNITYTISADDNRDAKLTIGSGNVTIASNITFGGDADRNDITFTGNGSLTIGGAVNGTGAFTCGTGTVQYNGASAQIVNSYTYNNLSLSGGTKTAGGNITVNTTLDNSTTFDMAGNTLTLGTSTSNTGTVRFSGVNNGLVIATGTVEYYGGGQNIASGSYNNLILSGTGTKTASGNISIGNTLNNSVVFDMAGYNLTLGTVTNNSGTVRFSGANNGRVINSGTVDYYSGGAQIVASGIYNNLTLSGGNKTTAGNISVSNTLNNSASFDLAGYVLTLGTVTNNTGIVRFSAAANGLSINTGTVEYYGAGAQTITAGNYNNLIFSGNRGGATITLPASVVAITGSFTPSATNVVYGRTGNTIVFNGAGSQNIPAFTFNNLTLSGGTKTATGTITIETTLTNSSVFDMVGYTLNPGINPVSNTGNIRFSGASNGRAINTGIVEYYGTSTQNITSGTYNNLVLTGGTKNATGNITSVSLNNSAVLDMTSHTLAGPVTNAGTIRFSGVSNARVVNSGTIEYSGAAQNLLAGTYNNLVISGGNVKTLQGNVILNGSLTLINGIIDLGNRNITVRGAVNGGSLLSFVRQSETGTGRFIKGGSAINDFISIFPIGNNNLYTPAQLKGLSASSVAVNSTITISTFNSVPAGITGSNPLNRHWVTTSSGISGNIIANFSFTYDNSDRTGGATQYDLFYNPAGTWLVPSGMGSSGVNPLTSVTAPVLNATWGASVSDKRIFYTLKSGDWNDADVWTLDPSGTQINNPAGITPSTSPTRTVDEVVILSGRTVKANENNLLNAQLTVLGTLDLGSTSGHTFVDIKGKGRIRLSSDNFPSGNATDFITKGQGEGTVEYYGTSFNLTQNRTFYNVDVNMTAGNTLTLLNNYTLNGSLNIKSGAFSINDNTSVTNLNIIVKGDITVKQNASIVTGTANARHQLDLFGDLKNYGTLKFTNRSTAVNTNFTNEAIDGIVDLNCINASANQSIFCDGISNFYRIKIEKGTDATYILNIDATSAANFNLFGFTDIGHPDINQLTINENALALIKGTVRIGSGVSINSLAYRNNYNISAAAQLWIDGGTVLQNNGNAIVPYGKIRITDGLLEAKVASGITVRESGLILIDGGVTNVNQIRTSVLGTAHLGGFIQTDGEVNVGGTPYTGNYYSFCLTYPNSIFNMSGGTLRVLNTANKGTIFINSAPENIKVTGGTVIVEASETADAIITSKAPFWDLEFRNSSGASRDFDLREGVNVGPAGGLVTIPAQPLKVLNDFKIWGKESGGVAYPVIRFTPVTAADNVNDVYIGGSFFIENGAEYITAFNGTAPFDNIASQPTIKNTTYFNQTPGTSGNEEFYYGNTTTPLESGKLVVDRASGNTIGMTAPAGRTSGSVILDINGEISILSGSLSQGNYTIRAWGSITNYDRLGTWIAGTTPSNAQILFTDNAGLIIITSDNAVFGNIQFNIAPPSIVSINSDIYVERLQFLKGLIYIKNHNLKIDNLWNLDQNLFEDYNNSSLLKLADNGLAVGCNSMIFTDGRAGDGGLTLKVTENTQTDNPLNRVNNRGPISFPVGFSPNSGTTLYFRPAQLIVKDFSDDGYITVRPVMGALQTSNLTGGEALQHYWRVGVSDFNSKPNVAYRFYYRNQTGIANVDLQNNETNFLPGKVLDQSPYTRLYESAADNDIVKNFGLTNNSRAITFNGSGINGTFDQTSTGFPAENSNYSAGVLNRYTGSVLIYYTRDRGINDNDGTQHIGNREPRWRNNETWTRSDILNTSFDPHDSRQPAVPVGDYPKAGDVAQIGWVPFNDINKDGDPANGGTATDNIELLGMPHGVWIDNTSEVAAEVVFYKMLDIDGNPVKRDYRSNFQFRPTLCVNNTGGQLVAKNVRGEGMFWNRDNSDPNYDLMDIGDFAREDSSYVLYENFDAVFTYQNTAPLFPNVMISNDGWGTNNHSITFARDINTTGDFEILGDINLVLANGATGDINIGRTLKFFESSGVQGGRSGGGGQLAFQNNGTSRTVTIGRGISMRNTSSVINVLDPSAGIALEHKLKVTGDIYIDEKPFTDEISTVPNGLQLGNSGDPAFISLWLEGSGNATFSIKNPTVGNVTNLYKLIVNIGSDISSSFQIDCNFNLNGPVSGIGVTKALELKNGLFIVNNAAVNLNLTSGNDYFSIPANAGLEIRSGIARASGNSGINLDGALRITGGTLDMSGGDNPIEYSSSGNSELFISGGSLIVGSQIRRSPTSKIGTLKYIQEGGSVIVGQFAAPISGRGVFEILNPGSSFNFNAGELYICRQQINPTIASFYLDPQFHSIGASANLYIGHPVYTPVNQTIGIYTACSLPKLQIIGYNNPVAKLEVVPATITNLLQVDAGAIFNANGLDLHLSGDMSVLGSFVSNKNTSYFEGSANQIITGNGAGISFYNLYKTSANNLSLNAGNTNIVVENVLELHEGIFTDNSNNVFVKGNCLNDATHIYGGAGDGITLNGTTPQILTGNGVFGKLSIDNINGVSMPVANQIKIVNALKLQAGIFNIGKNLLDLEVNAAIEQASAFSETNMIETNISFTDNGVRKKFPVITAPATFTFPVGCDGKFTPVIFNISSSSSEGTITVKPANEIHPSIVEDTETGTQIVDANNALQYYWTLKSSGITGFSSSVQMKTYGADVKFTLPYTSLDYLTAKVLNDGAGQWFKYGFTDFDEIANTLTYTFSGASDIDITADYTAGACDGTKNGAIPDNVSKFESNQSGNWNTAGIWTPEIVNGPVGAITVIRTGHTVDVTVNNIEEYATDIYGTLNLGVTYGHRHGIVGGNGRMYLEQGSISAGVYDEFFSSSGGTIEFGGSNSYDVLGNILSVNHLTFSGEGLKKLPNNNLEVLGNLTINGNASLSMVVHDNSKINLHGNLLRYSGGFESGLYSSIVFKGGATQNISGSFTGENAFNGIQIYNNNGVNLNNDIEITGQLKLSAGLINTNGHILRIKLSGSATPVNGLSGSFVNGALTKEMINGGSFVFPIGDDGANLGTMALVNVTGTSGVRDWRVTYNFANPTDAGYTTTNIAPSITQVSNTEYWQINAPAGGSSKIKINLDGSSDVASAIANINNLRVVGWNAGIGRWDIVGTGAIVSGSKTSGTVATSGFVNCNTYTVFTLAAITPIVAATATITSSDQSVCAGNAADIHIAFTGTFPWQLTYYEGAILRTLSGITTSPYTITVSPASNTTYKLNSLTANGFSGSLVGKTETVVTVKPNPSATISSNDADNTFCAGTMITFTANAGMSNYIFRVNGNPVQNSASNVYTTNTLVSGQSVNVDVTLNGCLASSSSIANTVSPKPDAAGVIAGNTAVCTNTSNVGYSIDPVPNAENYVWNYTPSTGVTINNGSLRNPTIDYGATATSGILTVNAVNACGNGIANSISIVVSNTPAPTSTGVITGVAAVCAGGSNYSFTVTSTTNATGYIWTLSGTGATVHGTSTPVNNYTTAAALGVNGTILIDFSASAGTGARTLSVRATNGCSTPAPASTFAFTVNPSPTVSLPATYTGCSSGVTLTAISSGAGTLTHNWTAATGTLSVPPFSNTTNFSHTSGGVFTVNYMVTDGNNCSTTASTNVSLSLQPVANAGIAKSVCSGTSPVNMDGATAMGSFSAINWTGAGGTWNINPADPALAQFTPSTSAGSSILTLTLTGADGCSNATSTRTISWGTAPAVPVASNQSKCSGATVNDLTATAESGSVVDWYALNSGGAAIPVATVLVSGNYYAQARNTTTSCISVSRTLSVVTVNSAPVINAGIDREVCGITPFTITDASATNVASVNWVISGGGSLTNSTGITPVFTAGSNADANVELQLNAVALPGCANDYDIKNIKVNPSPETSTITHD